MTTVQPGPFIAIIAALLLTSDVAAQWVRVRTWLSASVPTCPTPQCQVLYSQITPTGSMKPGTRFSLQYDLSELKQQQMYWAFGTRWYTTRVPLFGGLLFTDLSSGIVFPQFTDPFGSAVFSATLPLNPALPLGTKLVVQAAGAHSMAPGGVAISEAWVGTTQ